MFGMLGGGRQTNTIFVFYAFSKQYLYINYFNPSYGLKDINLLRLTQFNSIKSFSNSFINYLIQFYLFLIY